MSDTIVDMPKVTQMLDAGWRVVVYKNGLDSYSAEAIHRDKSMMDRVRQKLADGMRENTGFLAKSGRTAEEAVEDIDFNEGYVSTDDFTPEQALTRLTYKVHGEII